MEHSTDGYGALSATGTGRSVAESARRTPIPRSYLMCPPTHFGAVHSVDPRLDPGRPVATGLAAEQWQRLHDLYVELGHSVELIEPVPGLPDMVFAANGATVLGTRALAARVSHDERTGESASYVSWFNSRGFQVRAASWPNEGQGDFLAAGDWLLAGSGFRTDRRSHAEAEEYFDRPVIGLTLTDERYDHLDTALAVLDEQTVMYYPGAFSRGSQEILRRLFPDGILASRADAATFGLNAVSDGRHVVLAASASRLAAPLLEQGFVPIRVDVSELLSAGGGIKCCTLELGDSGPAGSVLTAVVSSVSSDSHTWNLIWAQLTLEEFGYRVINLGACVPDELLIAECLRIKPDLVVISSVNGHGFHDGSRMIGQFRSRPELAATRVVIGGKLGISGPGGRWRRDELCAAGFDAVCEDGAGANALRAIAGQQTVSMK